MRSPSSCAAASNAAGKRGAAVNDMRIAERNVDTNEAKIAARGVQVHYGTNHALKDVDVDILDKIVTAFIGPSGCG